MRKRFPRLLGRGLIAVGGGLYWLACALRSLGEMLGALPDGVVAREAQHWWYCEVTYRWARFRERLSPTGGTCPDCQRPNKRLWKPLHHPTCLPF